MTAVRPEDQIGAPDRDVIERLAATERLLVATDFDGVLAPLVDDPGLSAPIPGSIDALARLAATRHTTVAIVSGRERRQLLAMLPRPERFTLVGSHGAEIDDAEPGAEAHRRLDALAGQLLALASEVPGFHVEVKALSVAAHFRRIPDDRALHSAIDAVEEMQGAWPDKVVNGKEVIEFTIATATKGDAIVVLGHRAGATATVYLGDDLTDEDAFTILGPDDVGIKVGPGPTSASHRVKDPGSVVEFLDRLASLRNSGLS